MCRIVGSFHPEGRTCEPDVIARIRDRMVHRGPDGCGLWGSRDRRRLGHRRLSIIDMSAAARPMANRDQTVVIAFNGESTTTAICAASSR